MKTTLLAVTLTALSFIYWPAAADAQEARTARGTVSEIGGNFVTVQVAGAPMTFTADKNTEVEKRGAGTKSRQVVASGKAGPQLSDVLTVGQPVAVTYRDVAGKPYASMIKGIARPGSRRLRDAASEMRSTGTVKVIAGDSITILGDGGGGGSFTQTFVVSPATKVIGRGAGTAASGQWRESGVHGSHQAGRQGQHRLSQGGQRASGVGRPHHDEGHRLELSTRLEPRAAAAAPEADRLDARTGRRGRTGWWGSGTIRGGSGEPSSFGRPFLPFRPLLFSPFRPSTFLTFRFLPHLPTFPPSSLPTFPSSSPKRRLKSHRAGDESCFARNGDIGCRAGGVPSISSISMPRGASPPVRARSMSTRATARPTFDRSGSCSGRNVVSCRSPRAR